MKDLYEDKMETVSGCIDEIFSDEQKYKKAWAMQAKRCVAFANGDQNPNPLGAPIMVNNQPINYAQQDSRMNMYQTNEIEAIIRTLVSYMTRAQPSVEVGASSHQEEDKSIARIGEKVHEAKYYLDNEYQNSTDSAFWGLTIGNVFAKDFWDYTLGDYTNMIDEEGNIVIDPETGEPKVDQKRSGMNSSAILTPLSLTFDHSITDFDQQPYVGESYVMDVDWAREAFDQDLPGYTGLASDIEEDGFIGDTLATLEEMKFAIPYLSMGAGFMPKSKGKCLVREWYVRPNRKFSRGRLIIKAGNKVVYMTQDGMSSPYWMPMEPEMWHPYTRFIYENYVGRFLGKSLVEQLIPLQMRLNEINGAILENANTLAKPNILAAEGQLKRGVLNGKGANIYTYRVVAGASPPSGIPGYPLPAQFFAEKKMIIDQMVRIAGTNFVMQGQPPSGVSAASAINQLLENANTQHSDMMNRWQKYHEQRFTKKLRLIHKFNKYPSKSLNKYLRSLCKDALDQQIEDFVGARDISDGVNVKIQYGSMIPKSETIKNQTYQELAKAGALGPAVAEDSPRGEKVRTELLEKLGLEPLETEGSIDLKKAEWENGRLLKGLPVEVSPYDIAAIHLPCHTKKIQDPKFLETASDQQKIALDNHIKAHNMMEAQKAAAAAPPPMLPPPGILANGPGAIPNPKLVNLGKALAHGAPPPGNMI